MNDVAVTWVELRARLSERQNEEREEFFEQLDMARTAAAAVSEVWQAVEAATVAFAPRARS